MNAKAARPLDKAVDDANIFNMFNFNFFDFMHARAQMCYPCSRESPASCRQGRASLRIHPHPA